MSKPKCQGCGQEFLVDSSDSTACDDCFICRKCSKRFAFSIADPPPLGMCDDCLGMNKRDEESVRIGEFSPWLQFYATHPDFDMDHDYSMN